MERDKINKLQLIQEIQKTVEQMKIDDVEDNPSAAEEEFQCPCCGKVKPLAGSVLYIQHLFCNDCVLLTEISLELGKIQDPEDMIDIMDDKRFENIYEDLFGIETSPEINN